MGASSSTAKATVVTEIVNNTVFNFVQSNSAAATAEQIAKIKATSSNGGTFVLKDFTMQNTVAIDFSAMSSVEALTELKNEIVKQLENQADAQTGALAFGSAAVSEAVIDSKTQIENNFSTEVVQECLSNLASKQVLDVTAEGYQEVIIQDVNMTMISESITKCIMDSTSQNYVDNATREDITQQASSRVLGLLETIPAMGWIASAACCLLCCIVCIAMVMMAPPPEEGAGLETGTGLDNLGDVGNVGNVGNIGNMGSSIGDSFLNPNTLGQVSNLAGNVGSTAQGLIGSHRMSGGGLVFQMGGFAFNTLYYGLLDLLNNKWLLAIILILVTVICCVRGV